VAKNITQSDKARLGGLRRIELYGNPGTPEGRSRGGRNTIRFFHSHPTLAKKLGFIIRKEIKYPSRGNELAELIGIILGDGGLPGNHQISITFNRKTDLKYSEFITSILKRLFGVDYHVRKRKDSKGADIIVSSSNLVNFLIKQGLVRGNKVKNQITVPRWICKNQTYKIACLRGLMDTDGGLYLHRYKVNGKTYKYLKLSFANRSKPVLNFMLDVLRDLNYKAYLNGDSVSIYSSAGVKKLKLFL
jgi:hypothetical protein